MTDRPIFQTRTIRLIGQAQVDVALAALRHAPVDPVNPLELILREEKKTRKLDQNALMWVGPLRDIAEQAWIEGRQYADLVWHEYFKRQYLPEDDDPELDLLAKDGYRKWATDPSGDRVLIGSTTQLTIKGMARYLTQIEAYGADMGVTLHASPNQGRQ